MEDMKGTRIGKSLVIRGEVTGAENLQLDGVIDGGITLDQGRLTVGAEGHAKAKISAHEVVVSGRVDGDIVARDKAEFLGTASFTGHLVAARLSIQGDARLKGSIDLSTGRTHKVKPVRAAAEGETAPVAEREPALV